MSNKLESWTKVGAIAACLIIVPLVVGWLRTGLAVADTPEREDRLEIRVYNIQTNDDAHFQRFDWQFEHFGRQLDKIIEKQTYDNTNNQLPNH